MRPELVGPRLLLRRLREVMADPVDAQVRLDKIVALIASNMIAEVCSVYVLRADGWLELFATEGLNRSAVHQTAMRTGEGLVGQIARTAEPLALSDAQAHPAFMYKPETGEESYLSFLGVPILRGGNILGVLVVQNKTRRVYMEEEVEALQTTAMLIAEMIASGTLRSAAFGKEMALQRSIATKGVPIAEGVGLGLAVLHEPRVTVHQLVAEDVKREEARLELAIESVRHSIDRLLDGSEDAGPGEHREILETFRMIANDRGWLRRLREAVEGGLTAEAAVEHVQNDTRAKLQRSTDQYMRERLHDLDDLANRLLHELTGQPFVIPPESMPENAILIARSMGPAALLDYDRTKLRGLVLEEGGAASHVAIVARSLGIPTVGEVPSITDLVESGDPVIIDGMSGDVQIRPQPDVELAYKEKARLRARRQEQYQRLRDEPAETLDGVTVKLHMNAGLLVDLPHVAETGATSIGLFRTELQFMLSPRFPLLRQQYQIYKTVFDAIEDRPTTFRTLDIGGDKTLPYMIPFEEENPALGWRAMRMGLDRPTLLRVQIRALLKAAQDRHIKIMFPMITTCSEFDTAKAIVQRELAFLTKHGHAPPSKLELGIMLEVPSLLWELDEILERVDFISVGSNDLVQYLHAADRDNPRVAKRFDALSVPILRALRYIAQRGAAHNKTVTLCGEIGGRPLEALALVAIGYRSLSMSPASIGPIKAMIRSMYTLDATDYLTGLLNTHEGADSIRDKLKSYAKKHQILI